MCDPVSITLGVVTAALGTAGAVAGYQQQNAAAAANVQYQEETIRQRNLEQERVYQEALRAQQDQAYQINNRLDQEQVKASQEKQAKSIEAAKAQATARASAASAGVAGLSINDLLSDYDAQAGRYLDAVDLETKYAREQSRFDLKSSRAQLQSQVNSIKPIVGQKVFGGNAAALGLDIGSSLLGGVSTGLDRNYKRSQQSQI